ncbi:hypothetical protein [Pontibacter sp. SGAir0037]|uniref:hypothetical protein n=1 Tax=Pontibacter sp. SGAir0037 TaxID=2571030 RepID=UPI00143E0806|nr:hypothetical protein [Pontibacter sp. SGAir0037]
MNTSNKLLLGLLVAVLLFITILLGVARVYRGDQSVMENVSPIEAPAAPAAPAAPVVQ